MTTVIYDRVKNLLPQQYLNAPNINGIIEVLGTAFEDALNVANDIKNLPSISGNSGSQLDLIGSIVGEQRSGRDDAEYRAGIEFKIFQNTSKATVGDIKEILKSLQIKTLLQNFQAISK